MTNHAARLLAPLRICRQFLEGEGAYPLLAL